MAKVPSINTKDLPAEPGGSPTPVRIEFYPAATYLPRSTPTQGTILPQTLYPTHPSTSLTTHPGSGTTRTARLWPSILLPTLVLIHLDLPRLFDFCFQSLSSPPFLLSCISLPPIHSQLDQDNLGSTCATAQPLACKEPARSSLLSTCVCHAAQASLQVKSARAHRTVTRQFCRLAST